MQLSLGLEQLARHVPNFIWQADRTVTGGRSMQVSVITQFASTLQPQPVITRNSVPGEHHAKKKK
jgi:hypothetical protein